MVREMRFIRASVREKGSRTQRGTHWVAIAEGRSKVKTKFHSETKPRSQSARWLAGLEWGKKAWPEGGGCSIVRETCPSRYGAQAPSPDSDEARMDPHNLPPVQPLPRSIQGLAENLPLFAAQQPCTGGGPAAEPPC